MNNNDSYLLLITGFEDNDTIARQFAGEGEPVYFKLAYVPPYGNFKELKRLQIATKNADLFNSGRTNIIMDISEWVGYAREEYFVTSMKFLCDQAYKWQYIFTVGSCGKSQVKPMLNVIQNYLKGNIREIEKETGENNYEI